MRYSPKDWYVWDTWHFRRDGKTHVLYQQVKRPGTDLPDDIPVGHAVSEDLLTWHEMPIALRSGPAGSYDEGPLFTGCCVEHEGTNYFFYGNGQRVGERLVTGISLATSTDGVNWAKHPRNPLFEPDGRWYYTRNDAPSPFYYHNWPDVDCRDICIVKDPRGAGWLGYVAMRRKNVPQLHSPCIALCRSADLIHWEVCEPCCTPNRFLCFEVPDVYELNGRWYMTALTGNSYGQCNCFDDPSVRMATVVFEADSPAGPFVEVRENFLLASQNSQGYSARTIEVGGERLMFYTHAEWHLGRNVQGRMSWPLRIVRRPGGGLNPMYWPGRDKAFAAPRQLAPARLGEPNGWLMQPLSVDEQATEVMLQARVHLRGARMAGLYFRRQGHTPYAPALLATLDTVRGEVALMNTPNFVPAQCRRWPIHGGQTHTLRISAARQIVEVFVDDVLVLNGYVDGPLTGQAGLYVDGGEAAFEDITFRGNPA